jgi:RNase P/RNase MRP subunit POP5
MSKRYLLVRIDCSTPLSKEQFANAVIDSVRRHYGEIGLARIDPRVVRYETEQPRAIVSCRGETSTELQAAISLMSEASGTPLVPLVVRVSGTIKAVGKRRPRSR